MRFIRESSLEEYAAWYLHREAAKRHTKLNTLEPEQSIQVMRAEHAGKMRGWFNDATHWYVVELDVLEDLAKVVFLESQWTKQEGLIIPDGLNHRLLRRVAENAIACSYLSGLQSEHRHRTYYDSLQQGSLQLDGPNRIAICSAEPSEIKSNPAASYYLLDGVGRCLPYMILVLEQKLEPLPIESFLAERERSERHRGRHHMAGKFGYSGR